MAFPPGRGRPGRESNDPRRATAAASVYRSGHDERQCIDRHQEAAAGFRVAAGRPPGVARFHRRRVEAAAVGRGTGRGRVERGGAVRRPHALGAGARRRATAGRRRRRAGRQAAAARFRAGCPRTRPGRRPGGQLPQHGARRGRPGRRGPARRGQGGGCRLSAARQHQREVRRVGRGAGPQARAGRRHRLDRSGAGRCAVAEGGRPAGTGRHHAAHRGPHRDRTRPRHRLRVAGPARDAGRGRSPRHGPGAAVESRHVAARGGRAWGRRSRATACAACGWRTSPPAGRR